MPLPYRRSVFSVGGAATTPPPMPSVQGAFNSLAELAAAEEKKRGIEEGVDMFEAGLPVPAEPEGVSLFGVRERAIYETMKTGNNLRVSGVLDNGYDKASRLMSDPKLRDDAFSDYEKLSGKMLTQIVGKKEQLAANEKQRARIGKLRGMITTAEQKDGLAATNAALIETAIKEVPLDAEIGDVLTIIGAGNTLVADQIWTAQQREANNRRHVARIVSKAFADGRSVEEYAYFLGQASHAGLLDVKDAMLYSNQNAARQFKTEHDGIFEAEKSRILLQELRAGKGSRKLYTDGGAPYYAEKKSVQEMEAEAERQAYQFAEKETEKKIAAYNAKFSGFDLTAKDVLGDGLAEVRRINALTLRALSAQKEREQRQLTAQIKTALRNNEDPTDGDLLLLAREEIANPESLLSENEKSILRGAVALDTATRNITPSRAAGGGETDESARTTALGAFTRYAGARQAEQYIAKRRNAESSHEDDGKELSDDALIAEYTELYFSGMHETEKKDIVSLLTHTLSNPRTRAQWDAGVHDLAIIGSGGRIPVLTGSGENGALTAKDMADFTKEAVLELTDLRRIPIEPSPKTMSGVKYLLTPPVLTADPVAAAAAGEKKKFYAENPLLVKDLQLAHADGLDDDYRNGYALRLQTRAYGDAGMERIGGEFPKGKGGQQIINLVGGEIAQTQRINMAEGGSVFVGLIAMESANDKEADTGEDRAKHALRLIGEITGGKSGGNFAVPVLGGDFDRRVNDGNGRYVSSRVFNGGGTGARVHGRGAVGKLPKQKDIDARFREMVFDEEGELRDDIQANIVATRSDGVLYEFVSRFTGKRVEMPQEFGGGVIQWELTPDMMARPGWDGFFTDIAQGEWYGGGNDEMLPWFWHTPKHNVFGGGH